MLCLLRIQSSINRCLIFDPHFLISAVDEQNAQTANGNDFAQSIVTAATTAVTEAQVPSIVTENNRYEHRKSLSGKKIISHWGNLR